MAEEPRTAQDNAAAEKEAPPILAVSVSPHVKDGLSTSRIMWTVNASLLPAVLAEIWLFGLKALALIVVSVLACVITEAICQKVLKRPIRVRDGSAVITGLLLSMVVPPGLPLWVMPLAAVVAIFVTKELMGGLGCNVFNPALIGRAFLVACFPVAMTTAYLTPGGWSAADAITTATPLTLLKHGGLEAVLKAYGSMSDIYANFFLGLRPGSAGETMVACLLVGGAYLLYKRIISWHIPAAVLGTVAVLAWVFGGEQLFTGNPLFHLLSGGVVLGAFYMATDYTTSPSTPRGKLVFGVGVGLLTMLIRFKGGYPEGVAYAILLMNTLTPSLERWLGPSPFAGPARPGPTAA